jgi:hypothetical protein
LAEAKAAPLAYLFGCEERLEDAVDHLGRHALARIGHGNSHIVASGHGPFGVLAQRNVRALDRQSAPFGHRVARIYHEVEDRSLELDRIDPAMP